MIDIILNIVYIQISIIFSEIWLQNNQAVCYPIVVSLPLNKMYNPSLPLK